MSGHSKWSTIKHKKGAKDAKRGALFTKLARDITVAASEAGGDPDMNFSLRLAVDKAKQANMPKDNIERAIKKGTGEIEGEEIVRVSYEAYGPSGSAIMIDCKTDNTNRTISEVKKILENLNAKIADPGSVAWQFEEKGLVVVAPKTKQSSDKHGQEDVWVDEDMDEVVLELMEVEGVDDISKESDVLEVLTSRESFAGVFESISKLGYKIKTSELIKLAKDPVDIAPDEVAKVEKIIESLEEHDDVDSVWVNLQLN